MENQAAEKGTLRLYGCGGLGINIASHYANKRVGPNYAENLLGFIDTSRSNLPDEYNEDDVFILKNTDGSGKIRRENHKEIAEVIRQILQQIEPGDFNIVAFSASGGSGSVIGPLIIKELLKRKLPVVAMVVGSEESVITCQNTLNTLKSLAQIADDADLPVTMFYEKNSREHRRSEIDDQIHRAIAAISVVASNRNHELDSRDVANWVQFNKVSTAEAQLAYLDVFTTNEDAEKVSDPISLASVYEDRDMTLVDVIPEYQCAGYLREGEENYDQIHLVISLAPIPNIISEIQETLQRYHDQRDSRVKNAKIVGGEDDVSDTGLIL